jgi:uncharacterized repeat protein (TIGR02543 family)
LNDGTQAVHGTKTVTVPSATIDGLPANPSRSGYTFAAWNTQPNGTGTPFTAASTVSANITVYAQWTAITYTVTYNGNGGSGDMAPSAHTYDVAKDLTANIFTRSGFKFGGWNTAANGSGAPHADGESVLNLSSTNEAEVPLYAQWWPEVSVNIIVWVNEDGNILVSNDDITISKSGSGNDTSFTAEVAGAYSGVQWHLNGDPIYGGRGTARSIAIDAKDHLNGDYYLGVSVVKDGVPYSTVIHFTVTN